MREMKDSGDSWIGYIPNTWETRRIKEFLVERKETCTANDGYDLLAVSEYYGVAKKADVISDNEFMTHAESLEGYKVCRPDDLVMNIMLAWKRAMGVSNYTGITSPAYCVFSPKGKINMRYFHHLFRTDFYASLFKQYSTGIIDSRLRLYPDKFLALRCHYPPVEEQQRIADFLDRKCADIDNVLEKTKASIEEYRKLKQSVITEAVTKGVRGERPMKDSGIEWIGEIPEEWRIAKLNSLLNKLTDGTHQTPEYIDSGVPFLSIKDISSGKIIFDDAKYISNVQHIELSKHAPIERGDILFTRIGTLGVFVKVTTDIVFDIFVSLGLMKVKTEMVNTDYLVYYLSSSPVRCYIDQVKAGGGTSAAKFNLGDVAKTFIVLPNEEEQYEIASYLDQKCSEIDSLIESKERFIKELEAYRKSLIYEYVTGKKEVPA